MPGQGENRERGRKDCQELRRAPRGDGGTGPSYLRVNRIACATGKAKAPRWMRAVRGWRGCARRAFGHGMPCPYNKRAGRMPALQRRRQRQKGKEPIFKFPMALLPGHNKAVASHRTPDRRGGARAPEKRSLSNFKSLQSVFPLLSACSLLPCFLAPCLPRSLAGCCHSGNNLP